MEDNGDKVVWRTLDDEEFAAELAKKLEEELDELDGEVGKDRERDLKELADLAEVYETAFEVLDQDEHYDLLESAMEELEKGLDMWEIDPDELLKAKEEKIEKFGAFKKRTYIEKVSVEEDNPWMQRYLKSPKKYPEVK
jgi:predicted house-cleaning noncanonical NTP pyrophosphatase (MazG superfamily)